MVHVKSVSPLCRGGVGPHMNTTGPGVSSGSRETCVASMDPQSRQSPGRGSGGLGPHCNTSDLPDDSRDLSTSPHLFRIDPHHDTALFFGKIVARPPQVFGDWSQASSSTPRGWRS